MKFNILQNKSFWINKTINSICLTVWNLSNYKHKTFSMCLFLSSVVYLKMFLKTIVLVYISSHIIKLTLDIFSKYYKLNTFFISFWVVHWLYLEIQITFIHWFNTLIPCYFINFYTLHFIILINIIHNI